MRVLVTGGLGFIGSAVVRALVARGDDVITVDNRLARHGANDNNLAGVRAQLLEGDLRDAATSRTAVEGVDAIVHAAGHTSHTAGLTNPQLDVEHNIRATTVLLEQLVATGRKAPVVYLSTRGVYGAPQRVPVDEEHPCNPLGIYEWSKLSSERFVEVISRFHEIPAATLRISNAYGPGASLRFPEYGVMSWWIGRALSDLTVPVMGDGQPRRDAIYVDDVAAAVLAVLERGTTVGNRVFNVGASDGYSLATLARTIVAVARSGSVEFIPYTAARKSMEVGDYLSDVRRLEALGWRAAVGLEDGLARTFDFYRRHHGKYL